MSVATTLVPTLGETWVSRMTCQSVKEGCQLLATQEDTGSLAKNEGLSAIVKASFPAFEPLVIYAEASTDYGVARSRLAKDFRLSGT